MLSQNNARHRKLPKTNGSGSKNEADIFKANIMIQKAVNKINRANKNKDAHVQIKVNGDA